MDACAQGAISLQCGKITLAGPQTGKAEDAERAARKRKTAGRIAWGAALALLAFAIAWFNFIEPAAEQKNAPDTPQAVGTEPGSTLPDFTTELLSGETFTLSDYRGRVVIINFWGTTCAPCIKELPYFEKLKVNYPEVEILAIHNRLGANKAEAFLQGRGWDHLDFALDSKEKGILPLLNALDAMPQTIVVNRSGTVTYNAQASLTYEKLEALYLQAAESP